MLQQSLAGEWQFRQAQSEEWLPARVPGGVHTDLLALGRIPDPFVADRERQVLWVAESDWEYRCTFSPQADLLAQEQIFLACDGLDTLARVSLNGRLLGVTENMFRRYEWEIKPRLRPGENELVIYFSSPVQYASAKMAQRRLIGVEQALPGASHLRKAPCQFGWDWGPMLPPVGVWRDIRLEGYTAARLEDVHLRQRHQDGQVTLEAAFATACLQDGPLSATLRVSGPDDTQWVAETVIAGKAASSEAKTLQILIKQPQLWWPNGYGSQPLYRVSLTLEVGGRVCDQKTYQVGLRTIELRQQDDEWGRSFTFVVNGRPVFAKGSNWIPADSFPTRLAPQALEGLIRDAAAVHQNMLRVWGGGLFESDLFYELCDRYGLLVWQDFIFACSVYPLDDESFVENVRQEVVYNVRRLRHHACLALWCGNNEMEQGWDWGWGRPEYLDALESLAEQMPFMKTLLAHLPGFNPLPDWKILKEAYNRFFHATLPEWVARLDPERAYWPSSPSSDTPFQDVNGNGRGDAHFWGVWHGRLPFTAYRTEFPRFMSEFGFQALPTLETVAAFAEPADWNMTSDIMEYHQRSGSGNGLILSQMSDTFRMPKDFPALVYLSMVLQAEGIRYGVEHWRRNMQRVSGTLYWQLNDCWPVVSWSSIDYFGRWKALHYAARRFFAPLLLSIEDAPVRMGVHLTSDLAETWTGEVRWSLEALDGQVYEAGRTAVSAPPDCSTPVCELDFSGRAMGDQKRKLIFTAELWQGEQRLAIKVAAFTPSKRLALTDPGLAVEVSLQNDQLVIAVSARSLARFVELGLAGANVVFSDNYFDLPAGRTVEITCPLPEGWSLEQARAALQVRSLYDSF